MESFRELYKMTLGVFNFHVILQRIMTRRPIFNAVVLVVVLVGKSLIGLLVTRNFVSLLRHSEIQNPLH